MTPSSPASTFIVRPAIVPDEVESLLQVANFYDSEPLETAEFLRLWESWSSTDPRLRLVANVDGRIVGTSHCRRREGMLDGLYFLHLFVDLAFTRQGIGSELVRQSEEFAVAHGARKVTAFVPEEFEGRAFAESLGYVWTRTLFESVLPVENVDDAWTDAVLSETVKAVRFATLKELGESDENLRKFYEVQRVCDLDEPSMQEVGEVSWDDFVRQVVQASWFRPEGAFVAMDGDEWVGVHVLGPIEGSSTADMCTDFTGVLRPYRGRGLALSLKLLGVRYAKELGRTRIMTHNDSTNAPMLAVNKKLGFEPQPGWLFMTKEFPPNG